VLVDASLDPDFLAYAKEAFRTQSDNVLLTVLPYFDEAPAALPVDENTTLVVVLAAEAEATGRILASALWAQVPAAVLTLDPVGLQRIARERHHEIDPLSIMLVDERAGEGRGGRGDARQERGQGQGQGGIGRHSRRDAVPTRGLADRQAVVTDERERAEAERQERFGRLFAALGAWVVRRLPDDQLVLARAFGFIRGPFIENAIRATSLQNAAIAAVFFLPGADMPLLTLNQVKLFLRIAAAYDRTLDRQRLGELVVLLLSGFGFRALARRLVGLVPVLGWAIRGGVGYTGTLAIGRAAQEYFEKGGDVRLLVEGLRSQQEAGETA
jgi:uncharacterized protein (DUF697 family)